MPAEQKKDDERRFVSGAVWNLIGSFAFAISAWLTSFIIAKASGAGNYLDAGIFAVAASFGNIFRIVSAYGLRQYQVSDTGDGDTDRHYIVSRVITVLLGTVLCLLASLAFGYSAKQIAAINIYMLFNNVCAFSDVLHGVLQKRGRIDRTGISLTLRGIFTTVFFAACLFLTKDLLLSLGALALSSLLVMLFYDVPMTQRSYSLALPAAAFKQKEPYALLSRGLPMLLYTVFVTMITFAPRILLEKMAGQAEVGVFAYVFTPTVVITTFASGVLLPYLSRMTDYWKNGDQKSLRRSFFAPFGLMVGVGLLGVGFSMLLGRWMLTLLYDAQVGAHTNLLIIAVVASTLLSLVACCNNILIVARRLKTLTILNAAGFVLTMIACYILVPKYGMYGAGYAMNIGVLLELLAAMACILPLLYHKKMAQKK